MGRTRYSRWGVELVAKATGLKVKVGMVKKYFTKNFSQNSTSSKEGGFVLKGKSRFA
jgi:hypothetical protein